jgi:MFS family permease
MEARPSGALALLRRRPRFRALWGALALSYAGSGAAFTALTLYVQETHGTGTAVAAFLIASQMPRLLGPLAGGLVDQVDLRSMLIGCDLGQAALYALMATLPSFAILIVITAMATVLQTAYAPARSAALPTLVEADELIPANALLGIATNLYVAIGPLVGAILFAAIGVQAALLVNAVTFIGSAVLTRGLPPTPPPEDAEPEPLLASAAAGMRFIWDNRLLRTVVFSTCLLVAFVAVDNVALVFLARDTLGGSATAFGIVEVAFGIGMLVGSFALMRGGGTTAARLLLLSFVLSTLGTLGCGLAPSIVALALIEVVTGSGNGVEIVASETLIQQHVPRGMVGRVYGFVNTALSFGVGVALAFGGLIVDATSPRTSFLIAAAGGAIVTLAAAPTLLRAPTPPHGG